MLDDSLSRSLHPNMRWLWTIMWVVATVVLAGLGTAIAALVAATADRPMTWTIPLVVAVVGLVVTAVGPTMAWRRWRWDVTDLALTLRHGVVTRRVQALPFFRIQHIDTTQGPLDRALGVTALHVHTASITSRLPGIATPEAEGLRTELLARAAAAAREANTDGDVDAV